MFGKRLAAFFFTLFVAVLFCSPARARRSVGGFDRYGGTTRLQSTVNNVGITFFGQTTSLSAYTLTDSTASFPVDGRLVGQLLNPNLNLSTGAEYWYHISSNTATSITIVPSDGSLLAVSPSPAVGDTYQITGTFKLELIGRRWWFIDPESNAFFPRSVSLTDTSGDNSVQQFDAVYLNSSSGSHSSNLKAQAADTNAADVVLNGVTVQNVNDEIFIGSLHPFYVTYFLLSRAGAGGKIQWSYSSSSPNATGGWALLPGGGNPGSTSAILNSDGSYNLDTGGYLGPGTATDGSYNDWTDPNADQIRWWNFVWQYQGGDNTVLPADFTAATLSFDSMPRFYIRGTVTAVFTTAPILSRIYDNSALLDVVYAKYQQPYVDPFFNWFLAINERFKT